MFQAGADSATQYLKTRGMNLKYDDASWHSDGDFPDDLPAEAGATHIGMFFAWLMLNGMGGNAMTGGLGEEIQLLAERAQTPGQFFLNCADGKFVDDLLNQEANAFTIDYYDFDNGNFLDDYEATVADDLSSLYYVKDTWQNFDLLAPVLQKRLLEWRSQQV